VYASTIELSEAIARQSAVAKPAAPFVVIDRPLCRFCLDERRLYVRVNSYAEMEGRYLTVREKIHGTFIDVVWAVCSPCAEKRGMVYRSPETDD